MALRNEEILKKAIEKAVNNGLEDYYWGGKSLEKLEQDVFEHRYYDIIFSHDFAKAFWGEEEIEIKCGGCITKSPPCECEYPISWQYHLQEMVLEEDPIQYLVKFI